MTKTASASAVAEKPGQVDQPVDHRDMANAIRALAMDAVQAANSGHPGMPMGMADVATVLFTEVLNYDPADPDWADRDRFVLSAGHGSMLLYALLYLTGYQDMTIEEIRNFRQLGAKTAGHPEYGHAKGIETTTGPLGQGLANAVGMAIAERSMNARFGDEAVDHRTYVIAGDGCLMEGISHEAISLAGHLKLGRLIVLFDDNEISIDGPVGLSCSDDQIARFKASGWDTQAIDGHDPEAIRKAIAKAQDTDSPSLIACRTIIGYGAPTKQGTSATHGAPLGEDEIAGAREKLGWPHAPFEVPEDILDAWRTAGARGAVTNESWRERVAGMDTARRNEMERVIAGAISDPDLDAAINGIKQQTADDQPKIATRQCSGNTLEVLTKLLPEMLGGSADLTGSNNTKTKDQGALTAENFAETYIYYGIREHGMAAAMNGMALHGGVIPYGGTFMVFTDYCRPSIRLSALMGLRVIYVMTHDSIGLGEDGPTHQPVEHLAALRAMPNLHVFRPADLAETAECWQLALRARTTPSIIVLSRQGLPTVRTEFTEDNLSARGAYVLAEAAGGKEARKATLIGTGSELHLALEARKTLEADGIPAAVVSMPSMDLFAAQDAAYQAVVLGEGTGGNVRVAIEAAVAQGWERWVGPEGTVVGMTGFGGSAPAPELYKQFGITADAAVKAVKARV